jgi:hypothetical protein
LRHIFYIPTKIEIFQSEKHESLLEKTSAELMLKRAIKNNVIVCKKDAEYWIRMRF